MFDVTSAKIPSKAWKPWIPVCVDFEMIVIIIEIGENGWALKSC